MNEKRKPIYIYLLAVVVLGLLIYAVPKVTDVFETTEIIEQGAIQKTEEAKCYFVRDEQVYVAGAAGTAEYNIKEGTHIRTGTKVAKFKEDESDGSDVIEPRTKYDRIIEGVGKSAARSVSFEAQSSGVLSYYADGYESTLTPKTMDGYTWVDVQNIDDEPVELGEKNVRQSEPLFKICDNDNWYIMCWVESASIENYEVGDDITIQLSEGSVDMTVHSITQEGDRWKIIFWSNNYYGAFAKTRVDDGILISQYYSGLIVKNSCIKTEDGNPGVMVRQKNGDFEFVRVSVIASNGEHSALRPDTFIDEEGNTVPTVKIYDEILKRPGKSN